MNRRSGIQVVAGLIGLVKPMLFIMLLAILMGVIGNLASIFLTILGGEALLNIFNGDSSSVTTLFILIALFAFSRGFLRYAEQASNHYIAFKLLALIRDKVFAQLRKLAPAKLDGKEKGNLISMLTSDVELLEVFYAHTISPVMIALFVSIILVIYIGRLHLVLGMVAFLAYVSVGLILPFITSNLSNQAGMDYRNQFGELNTYVLESIHGLKIVDQYAMGKTHLKEMKEQTIKLNELNKKLKKVEGISSALSEVVILCFSFAMFFIAYYLYSQNEINVGSVLISTIALMSSFGPVNALSALANNLAITFASGERVLSLLEESANIEEVKEGIDESFTNLNVDHVSFAYDDELILGDIQLSLDANKIYGIQGKSGSGKSTLLKLLMRFYDVNKGSIGINSKDIKTWKTTSLRNNESYVTQETYLFDDTIMNNVRLANVNASDEDVINACKKANLHDFIMTLKDNYQTQIGALANSLSGGERQRIGLARAFLHEGRLILLDEPTSNLDSLNEAIIMKSLKENAEDKTILIVSHRESSMKICDEVILMSNGRNS